MEDWIKAGRIASEAREYGLSLMKENIKVIDILDKIEKFIEEKKAKCAFPPQISINQIAAHYTSPIQDETIIKEGDIAKLDIGVHINGCIADTAKTIEIKTKNNQNLIKASEEALNEAIKIVKPGTELREIGKKINETITKYGFKPVKNLSGHEIKEYNIHAGITIPNFDNGDKTKLKEGQIIALEPFATTEDGFVKEGKPSRIYRLAQLKQPRDKTSREIIEYIYENFKTLPFTERQLLKKFNITQIRLNLPKLEKENYIYQYPMLPEATNGLVSQAEHTIIVKKESIITTL
jgi:methionyl aminopeptidase